MTKKIYWLCSFVAGFSLMVVELLASRIVAPLIGNSIYTWTAVIGTILLGLSVGSILGGKIADKTDQGNALPTMFLFSAICVFAISPLSHHSDWLIYSSQKIIWLNLLLVCYLFLLPAVAMGTIQPLILKKYADKFPEMASRYGQLSAAWSAGSILGVFLTGYYLISSIGSNHSIYIVSMILIICGLSLGLNNKKVDTVYSAVVILVILTMFHFSFKTEVGRGVVYQKETDYFNARVVDFNLPPYGDSRALILDFDTHNIESKNILESQYTEIYPAFKIFNNNIKDILVLGAGAYQLPNNLRQYYTGATVSVVEIDPEIKEVAENYFNLKSELINTIFGDARQIINTNKLKYDLIYGDAYNSFISVPGYLLTFEFNNKIKGSLNPGGIYALNFIGSVDGPRSELFKSLVSTFKQTFPNFYVFAFGDKSSDVQNITLVGLNSTDHKSEQAVKLELETSTRPFLGKRIILSLEKYKDDQAIILSDDLYPTEKLLSETTNSYFPQFLNFMRAITK